MKAIPVQEAQDQLGQLIAEGEKKVTLEPGVPLDLEEDSPELEAELLKAVNGPHSRWRPGEFLEIADRALREHRAKLVSGSTLKAV